MSRLTPRDPKAGTREWGPESIIVNSQSANATADVWNKSSRNSAEFPKQFYTLIFHPLLNNFKYT